MKRKGLRKKLRNDHSKINVAGFVKVLNTITVFTDRQTGLN